MKNKKIPFIISGSVLVAVTAGTFLYGFKEISETEPVRTYFYYKDVYKPEIPDFEVVHDNVMAEMEIMTGISYIDELVLYELDNETHTLTLTIFFEFEMFNDSSESDLIQSIEYVVHWYNTMAVRIDPNIAPSIENEYYGGLFDYLNVHIMVYDLKDEYFYNPNVLSDEDYFINQFIPAGEHDSIEKNEASVQGLE